MASTGQLGRTHALNSGLALQGSNIATCRMEWSLGHDVLPGGGGHDTVQHSRDRVHRLLPCRVADNLKRDFAESLTSMPRRLIPQHHITGCC